MPPSCLFIEKEKSIKKNIYMILRNKSHTKCCGLQAGDETKDYTKNPSRCYLYQYRIIVI